MNNVFFLNLNFLADKGDEKLTTFAKRENLEIEDIIKIIYSEARKIGEIDKVKVTFKTLDKQDDVFKIEVEPWYARYKGTVIYPFDVIKSSNFEISLDCVCRKITLFNKKQSYKNMSLTVDGIGLDMFNLPYKIVKTMLIGISERKFSHGYIDFSDSICFRQYGIKINAQKDKDGNTLKNDNIESVDIYCKEEFFKEFYFEEEKKEETKYDVNIKNVPEKVDIPAPATNTYNYEIPKFEIPPMPEIPTFDVPQMEVPKAEIPQVEIPKFEEIIENEKQVEEIDSSVQQETEIEIDIEQPQEKVVENVDKKEELEQDEKNIANTFEEFIDEVEDPRIEDANKIEDFVLDIEIDLGNSEENKKLNENNKEDIQQKVLSSRIEAKLEELKKEDKNNIIKFEKKEVVENAQTEEFKSYEIVSYEGIKEKNSERSCLFIGQNKKDVRTYLGTDKKSTKTSKKMDIYDNLHVYYDEIGECTEIKIYNKPSLKDKVALYFLNENLVTMKYKDIITLIKQNDGSVLEDEEGIISLKYGISIEPKNGKNYQNQVCDVINIFKKGYYNEEYESF